MKTNALLLTVTLAAAAVSAQYPAAESDSRTIESESGAAGQETQGQTQSLQDLADQLSELRGAVEEALPILEAATETETNSAPGQTTGGVLAGVLGNILRGNTNQAASGTVGQTNALGTILRGVLGTNSLASAASTNSIQSDLLSLRNQLRSIAPVLDRLESADLAELEKSSTDGLTPTGRE
jgi:hypothetical protein